MSTVYHRKIIEVAKEKMCTINHEVDERTSFVTKLLVS